MYGTADRRHDRGREPSDRRDASARCPVTPPDEVAALVATARAAQPAWEALGYEGRGRILKRAQKWLLEHADEVADTIVAETGKAREDALLVEVAYGANALGFWPQEGAEVAGRREGPHDQPVRARPHSMVVRYRPRRRRRA